MQEPSTAREYIGFNEDFYVRYSPERINLGDKARRVNNIVKVTSGSTPEIANVIDRLSLSSVSYLTPSLKNLDEKSI